MSEVNGAGLGHVNRYPGLANRETIQHDDATSNVTAKGWRAYQKARRTCTYGKDQTADSPPQDLRPWDVSPRDLHLRGTKPAGPASRSEPVPLLVLLPRTKPWSPSRPKVYPVMVESRSWYEASLFGAIVLGEPVTVTARPADAMLPEFCWQVRGEKSHEECEARQVREGWGASEWVPWHRLHELLGAEMVEMERAAGRIAE